MFSAIGAALQRAANAVRAGSQPVSAPPAAILPVPMTQGGHWMPIDLAEADDDLERDEGFRAAPYQDTVGVWTNGFGNTHGVGPDTPPVTVAQALAQLNANFAQTCERLCTAAPWIKDLDPVRQDVLTEMAFNLGVTGLLQFKQTLGFVEAGKYPMAATAMLLSRWASQIGDAPGQRAWRLAEMMRTGVRP
jgi:lysozyme